MKPLKTVPAFLQDASFLPRITRSEGRVLEEALAPSTLFDEGIQLRGAIVEATYAATEPPILNRLGDGLIPVLIDPQTLRFTGAAFLEVAAFSPLSYRPSEQITAENVAELDAKVFARQVLEFEQGNGCAAFISPALPLYDHDREAWTTANQELWHAACDANGNGDVEARPMLAQVAPGRRAIEDPDRLIEGLMDLPVDGVYVQPLALNPMKDSVEKLLRYVRLLESFEEAGLPVLASRAGAFGVVLTALGVSAFDSGLGIAEACNLAALNRRKTERERAGDGPKGSRRIYLGPLRMTLPARQAELILHHQGLAGRFGCNLGCCRFQRLDELPERARQHCLWTRTDEVRAIRELGTRSMRLDLIHEELRTARETGRLVRRTLMDRLTELPSFHHADRWIRVLGRESEARAAA